MAYFKDLSVYSYSGALPGYGALNVGWLAGGQPFPTGDTSEAFRAALTNLCRENAIHTCMGHHACEICPDASWRDPYYYTMGNGEIWVRDVAGIWYAAPRLIIHYVERHRYCPPRAFVLAVMSPSDIGRDTWFECSQEDTDAQMREHERRECERLGGRASEELIDLIVLRAIPELGSKKTWWRRCMSSLT